MMHDHAQDGVLHRSEDDLEGTVRGEYETEHGTKGLWRRVSLDHRGYDEVEDVGDQAEEDLADDLRHPGRDNGRDEEGERKSIRNCRGGEQEASGERVAGNERRGNERRG